jgi:hypothetical protein
MIWTTMEGDAGHQRSWPWASIPSSRISDPDGRRAEYKRRQYPPGTKISFKAFGRDRRLPIATAGAKVADVIPLAAGRLYSRVRCSVSCI